MRYVYHYALVVGSSTLLLASSSNIAAQTSPRDQSAVVALADSLPWHNAFAAIVRDPGAQHEILVMRPSSATTTTLEALLVVLEKRRRLSPSPEVLEVTTLDSARIFEGKRPPEQETFYDAILNRLRGAPIAILDKIGPAQWIRIEKTHPD